MYFIVVKMTAVQEVYCGAAGWMINYPPPGRLDKDGGHYPNPFLTLETPKIQNIYRSFDVLFGKEEEIKNTPDASPHEETRNDISQKSITQSAKSVPIDIPLLTRQESIMSDASDSADVEYICLRCPEYGVCLSCGGLTAK